MKTGVNFEKKLLKKWCIFEAAGIHTYSLDSNWALIVILTYIALTVTSSMSSST
jgi:hypothetical protein